MAEYVILFAGPMGAGKTTAIRSLSEIEVVSTEAVNSDRSLSDKPTTTVALDYGEIDLDPDKVRLYGVPGQERFDFMWEILGEGMLGYVLLLDANRQDSLDEAVSILAAFRKMARVPFVVGLNRAEAVDPEVEARVRDALELGSAVPVVACDATDRASVKNVLLALLYAVVDSLDVAAAQA